MEKSEILEMLLSSRKLFQRLKEVDTINVIDYTGSASMWCWALQQYLWKNEKDYSCVKRIILLGVKPKDVEERRNKIHLYYPDAEVVTFSETWDKVNTYELYIDSPLVIHFAIGLHEEPDYYHNHPEEFESIIYLIEQTRLLYAALMLGTHYISDITVSSELDELRFENEPTGNVQSPYCIGREKYIRQCQKELTPHSALLACVEEAKHGCESCCMVSNYGKAKICPLAQHEIALMYQKEDKQPSKDLSHQLERLSASQGYVPAHIQVADNLATGNGCQKDVRAALSIYKQYARYGNIQCCDRIIDLAKNEETVSDIVAVPWVIRHANSGDLDKASILAKAFADGSYGVPRKKEYSDKWQTVLAESGDEKYIGELMQQAMDRSDWKDAIKWCRRLRDMESYRFDKEEYADIKQKYVHSIAPTPAKLYEKGKYFLIGSTVTKDVELAEICLLKAAEAGYLAAQEYLCEEYCTGRFNHDYQKSVYWGDKALAQGSRDVRFRVAWLRCGEGGVTPDYELSHRLYEELAKEGNSAAMNNLGWMYERGHFFTVNLKNAAEWYLKSAKAGSIVGARNIAYMYKDGRGTERNYEEAFKWFLIAANKEDKSAIRQVIECYKNGIGVEKNNAKVIEWYEKAIAAGDQNAIMDLAYFYESDMDDIESAIKYYRMAAEQDNSLGQYYLAEKYEHGEGVEEDINAAIYWYRKSAMNGDEDAKKKLQSLGVEWLEKEDE